MRKTLIPMLGLLVLVLLLGAGHGIWTDRWVHSEDLEKSLARLDKTPKDTGDWQGENLEYEPEDMSRAGIKGCVFRKYRNTRTGATVTLLLVCGHGGPISVHTPDVCYSAAGFVQSGGQVRTELGPPAGDFWKSFFGMPNLIVPRRLEIFWAWSRDGQTWSAPDNSRYNFARFPAVYKLYVVRETPAPFRDDDRTIHDFLARLLPDIRRSFESDP